MYCFNRMALVHGPTGVFSNSKNINGEVVFQAHSIAAAAGLHHLVWPMVDGEHTKCVIQLMFVLYRLGHGARCPPEWNVSAFPPRTRAAGKKKRRERNSASGAHPGESGQQQ